MQVGVDAFLVRLARDRAGSALFIMSVMMFVVFIIAGSAIDGLRAHVVKTRLQQACDAGVLAGRRTMTDTALTNTSLDSAATKQANAFFTNNFPDGAVGVTSVSFTPTKTTAAQVAGSAQALMPFYFMQVFGYRDITLKVTCEATYDVADTDVMFVLDTTGSMACLPSDGDSTCNNYVSAATEVMYNRPSDGSSSGNKSVAGYPGSKAYYVPEKSGSRISALRSAVLSFYDTLAAASDPTTHIRYGFVTYTSTVNAGRAVMDRSPAYVVGGTGSANTDWTYQSRYQSGTSNGQPVWQYTSVKLSVANYVSNSSVTDPTKTTGATSAWAGCLEERSTTAGTTSFDQDNLPNDLDPDLTPTSDITTQWKPMWPEVFYARNAFSSTRTASSTGDKQGNFPQSPIYNSDHPGYYVDNIFKGGFVSCGKPVSRIASMARTDIEAYVNASDFKPIGGTYHDVGMIWGTRMLAPDGIFSSDTAAWSGRQSPNRIIVFLTDGDMAPSQYVYGMYGNEYYDKRVAGGDISNLKAYHNARFLAECNAAKGRGIKVWTVSIAPSASDEMTACASTPSQAIYTTSGSDLVDKFASIAKQVAMLRISK